MTCFRWRKTSSTWFRRDSRHPDGAWLLQQHSRPRRSRLNITPTHALLHPSPFNPNPRTSSEPRFPRWHHLLKSSRARVRRPWSFVFSWGSRGSNPQAPTAYVSPLLRLLRRKCLRGLSRACSWWPAAASESRNFARQQGVPTSTGACASASHVGADRETSASGAWVRIPAVSSCSWGA